MGDAEGRRRTVGSDSGAPTYINLKIKSEDEREVYFNVVRSSELEEVMMVSCDRLSLEFNDTRFVYKGHNVLAEKTPDQLKMKDGDVIDAIPIQQRNQPTTLPAMINVTDNSQLRGYVFRMKRTTQLSRLMTAYCDRSSLNICCLIFYWNGRRLLRHEQTPEELGIEDGAQIDVLLRQPCQTCYQRQSAVNGTRQA